ncbi:putative response regulatory protein [Paenibacillus konkukensis]|uniref:Response regulatory protein n=1 Tax=Paenibacillus konkukensis TaxID=2020716 RepID=A0ABY4RTN0_9BACL|nr:response regulator [Paenibacillus konkukensis]UQZ85418.1 putative response regulatory protein [Paenibacillus konkukensis]
MKVLIVDDETHVRSTIRMLADWNALQVDDILEADNGAEAVRLIMAEQPQVVLTDIMMPLRNGLELMEWMDSHAPTCKKIVISGYSDFEYVRQTMKYGGTDYLLKPIVPSQLQEAMQRAVDAWREEERKRRQDHTYSQEAEALKDLRRDKLLSNLMVEPGGYAGDVAALPELYPALRRASACRAAVLRFEFMERNIRERYGSDKGALVFALIGICNDTLHAARMGTAFRNLNSKHEIGMLLWESLEQTEAVVSGISREIARRLQTCFDIGIGLALPFPDGLQEAYSQARKALLQRNLLDRRTRLHTFRREAEMRLGTLRFGEFEEKISLALKSGRSGQLAGALQEWFNELNRMETISLQQLELWQNEFNVLMVRWTEAFFQEGESGPELPPESIQFRSIPIDDEGTFSLVLFQERVSNHLHALLETFLIMKAQSGHTMHDIAKYIQANYQKNITLQDISAQFHLNREYISRKFKMELKENVIDYLNRVRIDKAKMLLLNPHVKIAEAARQVGYQDEKYFSRVFKKWEGLSPKEFRSRLE